MIMQLQVRIRLTTLVKLFVRTFLCYQAVEFDIGHKSCDTLAPCLAVRDLGIHSLLGNRRLLSVPLSDTGQLDSPICM